MSEHPGLIATAKEKLGNLAAIIGFSNNPLVMAGAVLDSVQPAAPSRPKAVRPLEPGLSRRVRAAHYNM